MEDLGTYVAKVAYHGEIGGKVLRAYNLARSHLGRHPNLSAIYEVAREWRENNFVALMTWVEGVLYRTLPESFRCWQRIWAKHLPNLSQLAGS